MSALLISLCCLPPTIAQETEFSTVRSEEDPLSFPREVKGDAGTVVIHTPQIDTWKEFASIE
jgi:hypothetical protein